MVIGTGARIFGMKQYVGPEKGSNIAREILFS